MMESQPKIIYVLTDYRGAFWSSTRNLDTLCSMNVPKVVEALEKRGYAPQVTTFGAFKPSPEIAGRPVLYTSSEDADGHYKAYIEDTIHACELYGAIVLPHYRLLRAHHNKGFAENLRRWIGGPELNSLSSTSFGEISELMAQPPILPTVLKTTSGAGSQGVALVDNMDQLKQVARKLMRSDTQFTLFKKWLKSKRFPRLTVESSYRKSIIAQQFVPGLTGDHKVLVYGNRLFVLARKNRPNDFRASGSGLFQWPEDPDERMLDAAIAIRKLIDSPWVSIDFVTGAEGPHVIEFQATTFGPMTLERSQWHFQKKEGSWVRVMGESGLEETFIDGAVAYLNGELDSP